MEALVPSLIGFGPLPLWLLSGSTKKGQYFPGKTFWYRTMSFVKFPKKVVEKKLKGKKKERKNKGNMQFIFSFTL